MDECVFSRIARGEMPATIVYKDEQVIVFCDIYPAMSTHFLLVSNQVVFHRMHYPTDYPTG